MVVFLISLFLSVSHYLNLLRCLLPFSPAFLLFTHAYVSLNFSFTIIYLFLFLYMYIYIILPFLSLSHISVSFTVPHLF